VERRRRRDQAVDALQHFLASFVGLSVHSLIEIDVAVRIDQVADVVADDLAPRLVQRPPTDPWGVRQ
jgi:hypothetical protein